MSEKTRQQVAVTRMDIDAPPASLPNAVSEIVAGLKDAVESMSPDDIDVELSASQSGESSTARFRLRAYRRGQQVLEREDKK